MAAHPMDIIMARVKKILDLDERGRYYLFIQDSELFHGSPIYLSEMDRLCDIPELQSTSYLCVVGPESTSHLPYFLSHEIARRIRNPSDFISIADTSFISSNMKLVEEKGSGGRYMLKYIPILGSDPARSLRALELNVRLKHPSILAVKWVIIEDSRLGILTDYKELGSLKDALEKRMSFTTEQKFLIAIEIASAMSVLHSKGILHLGLTPKKILLERDNASGLYHAFICGFGSARFVRNVERTEFLSIDKSRDGSSLPEHGYDSVSGVNDVMAFVSILKAIHFVPAWICNRETTSFAAIAQTLIEENLSRMRVRSLESEEIQLSLGRGCIYTDLSRDREIDEPHVGKTASEWKDFISITQDVERQFIRVFRNEEILENDESCIYNPCIELWIPVLFDSGRIEIHKIRSEKKGSDLSDLVRAHFQSLTTQNCRMDAYCFDKLSCPVLARDCFSLDFVLIDGTVMNWGSFVSTDTFRVARDHFNSGYKMSDDQIALVVDKVVQPDWRLLSDVKGKQIRIQQLVDGVCTVVLNFGDNRKQRWKFGSQDTVNQVIINICQVFGLCYSGEYERVTFLKVGGKILDKRKPLIDYTKSTKEVEVCVPESVTCRVHLHNKETSITLPSSTLITKAREIIAGRLRVHPEIVHLSKSGKCFSENETIAQFADDQEVLQVDVDTRKFEVIIVPALLDFRECDISDKIGWPLEYPLGKTVYDIRKELSQKLKKPIKNVHIGNHQYQKTGELYPPSLGVEHLPSRLLCIISANSKVFISIGGVYEVHEVAPGETVKDALASLRNRKVMFLMQENKCLAEEQKLCDVYDDVDLVAVCDDLQFISTKHYDVKGQLPLFVECKQNASLSEMKSALCKRYRLLAARESDAESGDGSILDESMRPGNISFHCKDRKDVTFDFPFYYGLLPVYRIKKLIANELTNLLPGEEIGDVVIECGDRVLEDMKPLCWYECGKEFEFSVMGMDEVVTWSVLFQFENGSVFTYRCRFGESLQAIKDAVLKFISLENGDVEIDLICKGRVIKSDAEFVASTRANRFVSVRMKWSETLAPNSERV